MAAITKRYRATFSRQSPLQILGRKRHRETGAQQMKLRAGNPREHLLAKVDFGSGAPS